MISFLLLLLPPTIFGQWIVQPQLDCRRVHPSFCCTSRMRTLCPRECSTVQCGPEYYQRLFSTDLNAGSSIRDGSTGQISQESFIQSPIDATTPPTTQSPPQSGINQAGPFPTLIPFEPSIDEAPSQDKNLNIPVWTTPSPVLIEKKLLTPAPKGKKNRTPDPRIIRPPDGSLVLIGDYEDGESNQTPVISSSGAVTVPSSFIENQEFVNPSVSVLSRSVPSGIEDNKEQPSPGSFLASFVKSNQPGGAVDGIAGRKKDIANGISSLINQFKLTPAETKGGLQSGSAAVARPPAPQPWQTTPPPWPTVPVTRQPAQQSMAPWAPDLTPSPVWRPQQPQPQPQGWTPAPRQSWSPAPQTWQPQPVPQPWTPPPVPAAQTCGVAPAFTPCVSAAEASSKLLNCCRQKNLPPGCQALCRYDITQPEVRAALDRGQCGILHVAPFLECAAQGKDNSECCSLRGVAQKTGPQCLQFCRPSMGLTPLGLQHVICGNAIGEMLQCHHSGIR